MTSPSTRFFPYHPLRIRLVFLAGGLLCLLVTAWALLNAVGDAEVAGEARAGVSAGLMFAFFYVVVRLRPHEGWGVQVEPMRLVISRPFGGEPTRLLWSEVSQVLRGGTRRNHLLLFLDSGGRILVPGHLFARRDDFEQLVALAQEKVPPLRLDA